jgi:hypothetical protein
VQHGLSHNTLDQGLFLLAPIRALLYCAYLPHVQVHAKPDLVILLGNVEESPQLGGFYIFFATRIASIEVIREIDVAKTFSANRRSDGMV